MMNPGNPARAPFTPPQAPALNAPVARGLAAGLPSGALLTPTAPSAPTAAGAPRAPTAPAIQPVQTGIYTRNDAMRRQMAARLRPQPMNRGS